MRLLLGTGTPRFHSFSRTLPTGMPQLEHIEAIERRLWSAADTLRANSRHASNEYFRPVMGLVFLRHAYSRSLAVRDAIAAGLPTRGGRKRAITRADFSQKNALFLRPEARFDHLVALPDSADRAAAIIAAMASIEEDYASLRGALPKSEYQALDNEVLGDLLRTLNPDELKDVSGGVFARIYEYFLTKFADQKAHDDAEFFTPVSLVSLIAHVLDPDRATVLDPARGPGGMFVQSARTVEEHGGSPTGRLTSRGVEKNDTTIRLARINLAVHGLEGDIRQTITYYEDPHDLLGRDDYVRANPPFNLDKIDADRTKADPSLPFRPPGVNKKQKVGNGNYIWISYFYSYLNERRRADFVMSSHASRAGRAEVAARRKLVETGYVDVMIATRPNFFYTRTVPCELWCLNRAKHDAHPDTVPMTDPRAIDLKVTRKTYDFRPEQHQNLLAIVWLYRGETARFRNLAFRCLLHAVEENVACIASNGAHAEIHRPLDDLLATIADLRDETARFLKTLPKSAPHADRLAELDVEGDRLARDAERFGVRLADAPTQHHDAPQTNNALNTLVDQLPPLADSSSGLAARADRLSKAATSLIDVCERARDTKARNAWNTRNVTRARKAAHGTDAGAAPPSKPPGLESTAGLQSTAALQSAAALHAMAPRPDPTSSRLESMLPRLESMLPRLESPICSVFNTLAPHTHEWLQAEPLCMSARPEALATTRCPRAPTARPTLFGLLGPSRSVPHRSGRHQNCRTAHGPRPSLPGLGRRSSAAWPRTQ